MNKNNTAIINKNNNIVWLASFDIGKKNFAFYIEEFDKSKLMELPYIEKNKRYNINGGITPNFKQVLQNVYKNGKKILFENVNLTLGCDNKKYLDPESFHNMNDILDDYVNYWDKCDAFIIEKQMSFGKCYNTMALKLGQHCWSYFCYKYGRFKQIIEFPAYYKTQILGAEKIKKCNKKNGKVSYKTIDKKTRKKWTVNTTLKILKDREDHDTISILNSVKKRDDLADVLCQLQAFKIIVYIDKSI